MNDIKVIDDLLFSLYFYGKDKDKARKDCEEVFNAWESIKRRIKIEEVESVYEKTFGNPIEHYPEMDKSQMIEEILEEKRSKE